MPRALLLLLVLALGLPASAAASGPLGRIVNGRPAQDGAYPAQGFLLLDLDPGPAQALAACGGTVISSRKFLTAGHCAVDDFGQPLPPENFNVFLGENDSNNFGDANRHFVGA